MSNNGGSGGPPYGWALIGCGGAGSGHARGAAETPEVEVRGFCDVVPESAERLQSEYGGYVTSDPQRIFDDPSVDIVSIATPHSMHTEPALAAIAAGKHLWLEKPMAMSTEECLQIAAAQRAAGTQLMLNFSFRFSGAVREAKRRLGRPMVSHAQCLMAPADLSRWRWDPVIGGGPLWDIGVHMVDLLCWFHEAAPVEVYATGGQLTHREALAGTDIVDTTAATLRFADGSVATLLATDADFNAFVSKWFFELYGPGESAVLYNHCGTLAYSGPGGAREVETLSPPAVARMPYLIEAIQQGGESYVPARNGIIATLVVENILESVRSGRPQAVELPAELVGE